MIYGGAIVIDMDVFLMNHRKKDEGDDFILTSDVHAWFEENSVERVVILNIEGAAQGGLEAEIKGVIPSVTVEYEDLPRIGLSDQRTPSELSELPWIILKKICKRVNSNTDSVMFLGRGAALNDHLLWLAAQCFVETKAYHINSCEPVLDVKNIREHAPVEETILPALLTSFLDDIKNKRPDTQNHGWIDAERFMDLINTTSLKGVSPALHPMVKSGGIEKSPHEIKSRITKEFYQRSVTYRLHPTALSDAALTYFDQKPNKESSLPNLMIAFGRLPHIQSRDNKDKQVEFDFFKYLSPLQPMDGLIVVLQRHDDTIAESSIMTLEQAIITFEESNFIGDLRHAYNVLQRRTIEDGIDTLDHLVIINPKPDLWFQMNVFLHLVLQCEDFESKYGERKWDLDMTMPVNEIRSAVSFFSYISNTVPSYVLKPRGESNDSAIPRRDLVINLPNRLAREAFDQLLLNPHGSSKGVPNFLIGLYLWEENRDSTESTDDLLAILDDDQGSDTEFGMKAAELQNYLKEVETPIRNLSGGTSNPHRSLGRLVEQRLVSLSNSHYSLTDLGRFVAEQLHKIRLLEVMDFE
jgi:hypothetical protein